MDQQIITFIRVESNKGILPIRDTHFYYVVENGKLKEKYQPFGKESMKNKPFRMDPSPAPGQYDHQIGFRNKSQDVIPKANSLVKTMRKPSIIEKNVGLKLQVSSKKGHYLSSQKGTERLENLGPGSYNPTTKLTNNRNDRSVLKWNSYEKRSNSIMKDIELLQENDENIDDIDNVSQVSNKSRSSKNAMALVTQALNKSGSSTMNPYHTHDANWVKIM